MGKFDIFDTIDALRREGQPFCVATVMRTADVTSAKAGAKAVITDRGKIIGHLGGACVQRAVKTAGVEAIESGAPRVIRVKPSEKVVSLVDEDGAQVFKSGCPSGGTVDLLIEPFAPPPMLVIFGNTPISRAVAAHGELAGYRVVVPDAMEFAEAHARFEGCDLAALNLAERDFVVVASQGAQDLASLRAALESPARRVSMVASRRKAEALKGKLADENFPAEKTARLKSPAGLDLGGVDPQEIALSVMAEIIQWRNADRKQTQEARHEHSA
ncbi:putative xanthine dehydrogenase subunit A [Pseudoruegeria aquimaris]|uniref:Putative xanthine dehydrogenase subunit A n=1 Tax=Pseudoruegeria aquimaris TaxID=393663 RepID=A0A1Y5RQL1_9RHOB|nr:XdhC family protein [Pseudoruegeria aquimaris]SLN22136.1 putative xanthine dehydrogenase subunit A [Pseudoruegeria aquimaris]